MSIHPLPQFEADVAEMERETLIETLRCRGHDPEQLATLETADLEALAKKKPKTSLVVRYGATKMIGEFPYTGDMTPGCGSRLVVRTHRGTEMGELLTSTCPNSGCGSSVSRKEMLEYIENSGGRQYPFSTDGRVIRIATKEDMDEQSRIEQSRHGLKMDARAVAESMGLDMKIVDAEPILGGERLTVYYLSEHRIDFRELVRELSGRFGSRIDMRQVGARDEARLTADYEKCGQYCCCKNFLKVLKPVSMKSAKVQKATLDPVKISGRCGRLMCCLRYEDETYESLAKNLPRRKAKVGTPDGDGLVLSTQILTQLVLVRLDADGEAQAYPVEEIGKPGERPASSGPAREKTEPRPARRERAPRADKPERGGSGERGGRGDDGRSDRDRTDRDRPDRSRTDRAPAEPAKAGPSDRTAENTAAGESGAGPTRKKRRRRRRRRSTETGEATGGQPENRSGPEGDGQGGDGQGGESREGPASESASAGPADAGSGATGSGLDESQPSQGPKKKRRRRRRRRRPGGEDGGSGGEPSGEG